MIRFVVSGGDPPECLEIAEEVLDEVSPSVGVEIAVDLLLAVRFGRDHGNGASIVDFGP